MTRVIRANTMMVTAALVALLVLLALFALSALSPEAAMADAPSPHLTAGASTDSCASCHRVHTGSNENLLESAPESLLCFSCHDGTGSNYSVAAEYSDINVPADNPNTSSYYAHRIDTAPLHTSAQVDEFAGVLNRHAACSDCHNPHTVNANLPQQTAGGWTASGAQTGITGVNASVAWQNPINYEYELCLKCHSRYTTLLSSTTYTFNKTDKAAELDPSTFSYHPIEAPGKNTTSAMQNSLNGGKLWQLTTGSTIRCTMCHGNYRLVGDPPTPNSPATTARLAPHSSKYRSLLIANYRSRELKPGSESYLSTDFALCYLCHSEAPFSTNWQVPRDDTNFGLHGMHLTAIGGGGIGNLDINTPGAGNGKAICAECHFETHGTKFAPWAENQNNSRGVNFSPNVQPIIGSTVPVWDPNNQTCTLACHGEIHDAWEY